MRYLPGRRMLLGVAGIIAVLLAVYLAAAYEYKHFYEFLVGGLALALGAALGNGISKRTYIASYSAFLVLALIGDLLLGLIVTGLWHYNYSHLWEYLLLYAWTYPLAGIVMYQSYALLRRAFKPQGSAGRHPAKVLQDKLYVTSAALLLPLTVWLLLSDNFLVLAAHFTCITVFFVAGFSRIAGWKGKISLLDDLLQNPAPVIAGLLATTYANLLLHEIPNTWAHEWVYTNLPWQSVEWLGVPIAVYPGWWALSLLPVALFYAVRDKE